MIPTSPTSSLTAGGYRFLKDECVNPFPQTFTTTGLGSNQAEMRHSNQIICSFVDGHVAVSRFSMNLGMGTSRYSLPFGAARGSIDFSEVTSQAEATNRLAAFMCTTNGTFSFGTFNTGAKTWDVTGMVGTSADAASAETGRPTFIPGNGAYNYWYVEFTVDPGTKVAFGKYIDNTGWNPAPANNAADDNSRLYNQCVIDAGAGKIHFGSNAIFSQNQVVPVYAGGYAAATWAELLGPQKGETITIPSGTTTFTADVRFTSSGMGKPCHWPTEPSRTWYMRTDVDPQKDTNRGDYYTQQTTITIPGKIISSSKPWVNQEFSSNHFSNAIKVLSGAIHVKRIIYSAK